MSYIFHKNLLEACDVPGIMPGTRYRGIKFTVPTLTMYEVRQEMKKSNWYFRVK